MNSEVYKFDVVVAGAALGGVMAAALLAGRGFKVALVETLDQPGGRCGGTERNGYWLDWGHRDGHGHGDLAWVFHHGGKAARELGLELKFKPWGDGRMRIHRLPEGVAVEVDSAAAMGEAAGDARTQIRVQLELLGMDHDDVVIELVQETMNRLAAFSDDEAWALVETPIGPWIDRHVSDRRAGDAIRQMLENNCASPAEHASLGRFIFQLKGAVAFAASPIGIPEDPEVGGVQGAIMPWVRSFTGNGGSLFLGWKPQQILVHNRQVQGLIAVDRSSIVRTFCAPVVISDHECWALPELVDPALLPRDFEQLANGVRDYTASVVSWWAGLSRLPRRRGDGVIEDHCGWQRIIRGQAPVKRYYGGYHFPSVANSRSAPPGKHLLALTLPSHGEYRWRDFADAKAALDISISHLREFYADLDECIEWADYQYMPDQVMAWNLKPIRRPPVKVATIEGLYLASATTEGSAAWLDKEAEAAIEAADLVVAEFGHLRAY